MIQTIGLDDAPIILHEINSAETIHLVKQGAVLLDVREPLEVANLAYDVPNLVHLPLSELNNRYQELPKNTPIIVACKSGGRSLRAAIFLLYNGYHSVLNLQHGIVQWTLHGFPVRGNKQWITNNENAQSCCNISLT